MPQESWSPEMRAKIDAHWQNPDFRKRMAKVRRETHAVRRARAPGTDGVAFDVAPCRCGAVVVRGPVEAALRDAECSNCRAERIERMLAARRRVAA